MLDLARVDLVELVMALSDQDVGEHQSLINPATGSVDVWSDDVGLDGDDSVDAEDLDQAALRAIEPILTRLVPAHGRFRRPGQRPGGPSRIGDRTSRA
jgi:hypothetical protein